MFRDFGLRASSLQLSSGLGLRIQCLEQAFGKKYLKLPKPTFLCRVPTNPILGCIIRTYKKVGYGSLR